jgi:RHS repeat-associated protein
VEERNRYYYGLNDELITWIRTPAAAAPTTYEERQYVPIGDFVVGEMARTWVSGTATSRRTYYHAIEPMGLELAAFEVEHPGGPAVTYNPLTLVQRWTGFGMRVYQTGAGTPLPTRFPGQIELRASDARIWNGSVTTEFAHALYLNRWRVYDPRVGQYLQPDPEAVEAPRSEDHAFAYSSVAPVDASDPEGRQDTYTEHCRRHPAECAEAAAGGGAAASGGGSSGGTGSGGRGGGRSYRGVRPRTPGANSPGGSDCPPGGGDGGGHGSGGGSGGGSGPGWGSGAGRPWRGLPLNALCVEMCITFSEGFDDRQWFLNGCLPLCVIS